jgi:type 1 glutamine amidotransferase
MKKASALCNILAFFLTVFLSLCFAAQKVTYPKTAFDQSSLKFEVESNNSKKIKIVLIPGKASPKKPSGNHEYMAGCVLMMKILNKMDNVHAILSNYEWPKNEKILESADVIVIYSNGDGKQGFLANEKRSILLKRLLAKGIGFVNLHGSICFTQKHVKFGQQLIGGVWTNKYSKGNRGHWQTAHNSFPKHAITLGVTPWKSNDGWCHKILIPDENKAKITPLLWSSKNHKGDPRGGESDIVAWTFDRTDGGRSFSCSGAHGHWEWANDGLRQLIINGILWTAKQKIPEKGFDVAIDKENMNLHFDKRK